MQIKENILLAPHTVFKIGGAAKYFCEVKNQEELEEALIWANGKSAPIFILGAGSNILFSDKGFPGLVIKMNLQKLVAAPMQGSDGESKIFAGAGVSIARAVNFAIENGLGGFEWGIGIPGTIGGSVFGNAGCYGGEMKDIVESVKVLEVENFADEILGVGALARTLNKFQIESAKGIKNFRCKNFDLENSHCEFSYRNSIFKKHSEWIILGAILKLTPSDQKKSRERVLGYTKKRTETQDTGEKCAGCIFKNSAPDLTASYLIDKAGLKGMVIGKAMVSEKHANYIVNRGGATFADVKNLIELIKSEVKKVHGVDLDEEIRIV